MDDMVNRREDAAFLTKWYGYLFWLIIPTIIGNIMTHETAVELFPVLQKPGQVISVITNLIWALILLKLKDHSDKLAFAGWGMIGLAIFGFLDSFLLSNLGITEVSGLAAIVVALVVEYHELCGHSDLLSSYDAALSDKWKNLWKWEIRAYGALLATVLAAVLIPMLGLLLVLVSAVALGVIAILKWVYIYQTKNFFQEYEINEKYRDIPSLVDRLEDVEEIAGSGEEGNRHEGCN